MILASKKLISTQVKAPVAPKNALINNKPAANENEQTPAVMTRGRDVVDAVEVKLEQTKQRKVRIHSSGLRDGKNAKAEGIASNQPAIAGDTSVLGADSAQASAPVDTDAPDPWHYANAPRALVKGTVKKSVEVPKTYHQASLGDRVILHMNQVGASTKDMMSEWSKHTGVEISKDNLFSRLSRLESNFMAVNSQHVSILLAI